eukprot:CAMPEP_0179007710 /NCGR_PEP_ID=MMETSP0795-20121207/15309_1 /TAXON_ID=88552 /ORGANISM="Amoebophrya sp., Strain Ameob2" /LENGTH=72 /DNA_ID=CAMNT_0020702709 /DNA_START=10 /DNA_END=223 /DNA_ORIENTATION=-
MTGDSRQYGGADACKTWVCAGFAVADSASSWAFSALVVPEEGKACSSYKIASTLFDLAAPILSTPAPAAKMS